MSELLTPENLGGAGVGLATLFLGTAIRLAGKMIRFLDDAERRIMLFHRLAESQLRAISSTREHQHRLEATLARLTEIVAFVAQKAYAGQRLPAPPPPPQPRPGEYSQHGPNVGAPQHQILHDPTPPPFEVPRFPKDHEK